ncbi:hypothetical protein EB75_09985 [Mycobacterium sp. ST-F2]|nr:hypothetical protein EB75_09985 [Mycobacterium sp. ST-F2]
MAMALLIPSSTMRVAPPWRRHGSTISASSRSTPIACWSSAPLTWSSRDAAARSRCLRRPCTLSRSC